MSKGGLTGAKVRIKSLESENSALRNAVSTSERITEQLAAHYQAQVDELAEASAQALNRASISVNDLISVNAELRDAAEEIQQQRDKAQRESKTYRAAFWILLSLTVAAAAVDTVFYWSMFS